MRINVHAEGFLLTPQLRATVVSRLLPALSPFGAHIQFVVVRLRAGTGHERPDAPLCQIAVSLHPSGEVRAQAEDAQMAVAIDRAANDIRGAVEREVSRLRSVPSSPSPVGDAGSGALEIARDDNRITQHQREWLERPEDSRRRSAVTHEPTDAEIQERAYYRYMDRGRIDGFDREDWRLAETELRGGERPHGSRA